MRCSFSTTKISAGKIFFGGLCHFYLLISLCSSPLVEKFNVRSLLKKNQHMLLCSILLRELRSRLKIYGIAHFQFLISHKLRVMSSIWTLVWDYPISVMVVSSYLNIPCQIIHSLGPDIMYCFFWLPSDFLLRQTGALSFRQVY